MNKTHRIVAVYNANSGFISAVKDSISKINPRAKQLCKLCEVTYNPTGIKLEWKSFLSKNNIEAKFFHKDEFIKKYPYIDGSFPAVYLVSKDSLKPLINSEDFDKIDDLNGLQKEILAKL